MWFLSHTFISAHHSACCNSVFMLNVMKVKLIMRVDFKNSNSETGHKFLYDLLDCLCHCLS